ncbi:WXG100 family type VII secretion target [Alloscardovia venturai]|uniref:ESAT-6-like protein n=1 Tax=Alloscardovia venturai TaxID=1769421 RepID=A0ABW2Y506_9BIFI
MPQYHVDSEQIAGASTAINASVEQIRSAVTTMYTQLSGLQGAWQGSAATQFTSLMEQWRTAQTTMEQSLQSIQQSLAAASQVYADAETQASGLFAR